MLSDIDNILFPNSCEVISLASQQFVYPIMKNGSSSFYYQMQQGLKPEWKILQKHELKTVKQPLIVFLRNPRERFISGVNTYIQHLERDNLNLDRRTVMWFVDNYLFLNRHYCPQFFWLINLARYMGTSVQLDLQPMSAVSQYANLNFDADVKAPTQEFLKDIEQFNWKKLELYLYLDQIIVDMVGQTVTFDRILEKIRQVPVLDDLIISKTINIASLLNGMSKT